MALYLRPMKYILKCLKINKKIILNTIEKKISIIKSKIKNASLKSQRNENEITLLAVSKKKTTVEIHEAYNLGINNFGESFCQEAIEKIKNLKKLNIKWHFIGKIQSNKTKDIAEYFDWVHTIDRSKIAKRLSLYRPRNKQPLNVCIQINQGQEIHKGGLNQLDETISGKLHDDNLVDLISLGSKQDISYGYLDRLRQDLTQTMTFDNFNYKNSKVLERGYQQAIEFASNPDGWLVIRGNTGSGKTHLAASITNQLETNETNCIFTFIPDLVDYLRLSINNTSPISHESLLKDLMTCEALILDDFGTKSNSTWIDEKIYQILVHRYESRLITVLTIRNLNEIPDSIISRLSDTALVDHIELDSPDYRQTKTQK